MRKNCSIFVRHVLGLFIILSGYQGFAQTFSADKTAGCAPLLVSFKGPAGDYDFDGIGANGPQAPATTPADPGRQYLIPGTYEVYYRATAVDPLLSTKITIVVYAKPAPAFEITEVAGVPGKVGVATGCSPLTVKFADNSKSPSSPIVGWTWYFGDGSSSTDPNPPPHTYAQPGTYAVELVVRTASCQQNIKKTDVVVVTKPPVINFTNSPGQSCGPETVKFTNTSTNLGKNPQYQWEFRDAQGGLISTSTAENPSVSFTVETAYTAKLTVKDASGCTSSRTNNNIFRIFNNYITGFSYTIDKTQCKPIKVRFQSQFLDPNIANQQVDWEVYNPANGAIIGTMVGLNPEYNFSSPGTYKVRAVSGGGNFNCPDKEFIRTDIQIGNGGEAKFTTVNPEGCKLPHTATFDASTSVNVAGNSYAWDFGDGTKGTGVKPNHVYKNYGNYTVKLTITDANGCKPDVVKDQEVRVREVKADFGAYLTFGCNDANGDFRVNFIDRTNSPEPITSWKWEFFNEANQLVGTVQGSDPNVHRNPTFTFRTVNVNDGRAMYSVRLTVSTANGCGDKAERKNYIKVGDKPRASFTANPPYGCPNTTVNFTYTGNVRFDSLSWFPLGYNGGRIIRNGNQDPDLEFVYNADPGTYVAGLVVWNGGCSDSTRYSLGNPIDPRFRQLAPRARANWFVDQCAPGNVFFTERSPGAQFWRWDFGSAAVTNAYPAGAAVRDFLPKPVPVAVRNPEVTYPGPGTYTVTLYTEADNVHYVTNPTTGARIPNKTGKPVTYTTNPNEANAPLHFGSLTTTDEVIFIRCRNQQTLTVVVPDAVAAVAMDSDYKPTNPNCFPVVVNFRNQTAGTVSWYWILGNGQVSTEENPTGVVYEKAGKYTVELVVTTETGCKFRKRYPDYVVVNGPQVNFDYCEADVCTAQNMQFKDLTTSAQGIKYRTWDLGNGVVFSNDPAVTSAPLPAGAAADLSAFNYAYPAAPTNQTEGFVVKLTVTEPSGCQATKTVRVRPTLPVPDFTISAVTLNCEEEQVTVKADPTRGFGPFRYRWTVYPKGSSTPVASTAWSTTSQTKFNLKATSSTQSKEYEIHLEVEDFKYVTNATGKGCYEDKITNYTVVPGQIVPKFSWTGSPSKCPPREIAFTDLSVAAGSGQIVTWLWEFGDGTTSNLRNPKKIYTEPNAAGYSVTLTVTDKNGCKQTIVDPNAIVLDGISGTFTSQQISGSAGPAPFPYPVLTEGPTVDYIQGTFTPYPYQMQFTAVVKPADIPQIGSYIWDFGDGVIGTGQPSDVHEYIAPGVYQPSLILRTKDGCDYGAPADIFIVANVCAAPVIGPVSPVCKDELITLRAKPPDPLTGGMGPFTNPVWTNLTTRQIIANQADPIDPNDPEYIITVPLTASTNFGFAITDVGGCESYTALRVNINPPVVAEAGENQILCQGATINLAAVITGGSGDFKYTWTPVPAVPGYTPLESSSPTLTIPNAPSAAVDYVFTLLVRDVKGCVATDKVLVKVNPLPTINAGPDAEICSGSSTLVLATAAGGTGDLDDFQYQWTAGPGPGGVPSPMNAVADPKASKTQIRLENLTAAVQKYTYFITVTDSLGCVATDAVEIAVSPGLTITYADHIICKDGSVQLTGTIVGGSGKGTLKYRWLGLGLSADNVAEPVATPTSATAVYELEVIEIVDGKERCQETKQVRVNWSPPIVVRINDSDRPDFVTVCRGGSTTFKSNASGGTGTLTYQWTWMPLPSPSANGFLDVVNGTVSSPITTQVQGITNPLEYTLTVTDSKGCTGSAKIQVKIAEPLADAGKPQKLCIGEGSSLLGEGSSGLPPYKYDWTYVSGPLAAGDDGLSDADVTGRIKNPTFETARLVGTYVYSLRVEDARGCFSLNNAQVTIIVDPLPDPPLVAGRRDYCKGETISLSASGLPTGIFKWYTQETLNPSFQVYEGANYETPAIASVNYYVTQTNPVTSCVSKFLLVPVTVNEMPPPPLASLPAPYCPGDTIAPLKAEGTHLKWYADIDLKTLLADNVDSLVTGVRSVPGTTNFYVTQSNGACEGPPAEVAIVVNPTPPAPPVSPVEPYCQGDAIRPLRAVGQNVKWYADANLTELLAETEEYDPQVSNSVAGSKTFYATQTVLGCVSPPSTVTIDVRSLPLPPRQPAILYCFEGDKTYTLDAGSGFTGFKWEHSQETTQTVVVTQPGIYFVNLTHAGGCTVRDSIVVEEICPPFIDYPNAFTPNNDGDNDNFQIFGRHFHDLELTIYNRWGEIIYVSKNKTEPWNGYYRGKLVQLGSYPWELKAVADIDGAIIRRRGSVTVIR